MSVRRSGHFPVNTMQSFDVLLLMQEFEVNQVTKFSGNQLRGLYYLVLILMFGRSAEFKM